MSTPNQGRNIERFDADHFQIRTSFGNEGDGDYILARREQIRLFFHYDHAIREAKTKARFAYCREDENGTPRVVISGPSPINKSQVETVNSLLWGVAERLQRQKEKSQRGYQDRRERREARRHERGPLAGRSEGSPFDLPQSRGTHLSKSDKRQAKPKAVDALSQYSSKTVASTLPNQPVAGPSRAPSAKPVLPAKADAMNGA
ncbi:hypothetical protein F5141DRAFT_1134755 [Pisolithus sp. B1]|nr:hypothetical protein F5141DRAFT_1134755 [Pisolithus sp. B1]